MQAWRSTGWLPRLEVVEWPALRDCQATHDAAALRLAALDPTIAQRQAAEALADLAAIVEVALLTLEVRDGKAALALARRGVQPAGRIALERDRRRLRRLLDLTLAPTVEYLDRPVPAALLEVHEALDDGRPE